VLDFCCGGDIVGNGTALACLTDGSCYVWGFCQSGQSGNGTDNAGYILTPQIVPGSGSNVSGGGFPVGTIIRRVSTHGAHCLALDSQWNLWSWGANVQGQTGTGVASGADVTRPTLILKNVFDFRASADSGVALIWQPQGIVPLAGPPPRVRKDHVAVPRRAGRTSNYLQHVLPPEKTFAPRRKEHASAFSKRKHRGVEPPQEYVPPSTAEPHRRRANWVRRFVRFQPHWSGSGSGPPPSGPPDVTFAVRPRPGTFVVPPRSPRAAVRPRGTTFRVQVRPSNPPN